MKIKNIILIALLSLSHATVTVAEENKKVSADSKQQIKKQERASKAFLSKNNGAASILVHGFCCSS